MTVCAVVDVNNTVVNIIVAEPTDTPPEGCTLVLISEEVIAGINYTWDGTNFIAPPPPPEESEPTEE